MTMKLTSTCLIQLLLLCSNLDESQPFTIHSHLSHATSMQQQRHGDKNQASIVVNSHQHKEADNIDLAPEQVQQSRKRSVKVPHHLRTFGQVVMERSDTLRAAGFYDSSNINDSAAEYEPITAGAKTNITLFLLALGYKWYRSIFINKVC